MIADNSIPQLATDQQLVEASIASASRALNTVAGSNPPKHKVKKDPNAPKQPMTSYLLFCQDVRASVKEKNPEMTQRSVAIEMGRLWKDLDQKEKEKYDIAAQKRRDEYNNEMNEYRKNLRSPDTVLINPGIQSPVMQHQSGGSQIPSPDAFAIALKHDPVVASKRTFVELETELGVKRQRLEEE